VPSALEVRAGLQVVTSAAVDASLGVLRAVGGKPEAQRAALLGTVPDVIAYYSDGSAALAADYYDEQRASLGVAGRFTAEPMVPDRGEKIGRAIAWATEPLLTGAGDVAGRLAEVVQLETARPLRSTILENRRHDPQAVGWRRVASGGCRFCRMLADRGAIYRESSARFAAHSNCHCSVEPVFKGTQEASGPEADVIQYTASKRRPTERDRQRVRAYLDAHYPA
jgi:hypothetical protein